MPPTAAVSLRFGRFELQPHERRLLVAGEPAPLGARALDLLVALAERAGQLVGKHALMDLVWPDVVVEENNLAAQISSLRKVLGGEVIATIPGRGYRFTAKLDSTGPETGPAASWHTRSTHITDAPTRGLVTNLPVGLPGLLGRADDLDALGELIQRHRLVSIVGAGGMGKTLTAQHLLDTRRSAYRHGVCWVELAPVTDPSALPAAIASALGVRIGAGEPLAALVSAMAPLNLLLALDNAEHLMSGVARLCQKLVEAAPGVHLLVTSQAPMHLGAERVYRLGPLAVPEGPVTAARALGYGAVALFTERAQAADARFALTDANAPAIIEVCQALDGLALAIELAAARAPMLGVQRLASSMRDRFEWLTTNRNRAAPARQQTLRAALEWSHGFLDERERAVFRRMAVVAGSASLELIQQVVSDREGAGDLSPWGTLDALAVLVDRSLVVVLNTDSEDWSAAPRYRLLDSARAFALERLVDANEHQDVKQRHARALAAQFDAAWNQHYSGDIGHDDWMRQLSFDLDNARDAMAWARETDNAEVALTIGASLLLALPPSFDAERKALTHHCDALLASKPPLPVRTQMRAFLQISAQTSHTGKRRQSVSAGHEALHLARVLHAEGSDPFALYLALCQFANASARLRSEEHSVEAALVELRALENPCWPPHRLYVGVHTEYVAAAYRGDVAASLRHSRRLVPLARARGATSCVKQLADLIDSELAAGEAEAAVRIGAPLVASLAGSRDEYHLNFAQLNLTAAWLAMGDREAARLVAQAGWPHAFRFDLHRFWIDHLALLAALDERPHVAAQLLGCSGAVYLAYDTFRPVNEAAAAERASALARSALGQADFDRCCADGAALNHADIAELAFGTP